jgi:ADP-ribose pyrophosphatase YjhB (NUDIX family)
MKHKEVNLEEKEFIHSYDATRYERPSVTVDIVVMTVMEEAVHNYRKLNQKELNILLIKRGEHPYKGEWALPGGFVHMNESIEDAAYRELKEETNLDKLYLEQLYTWGDVDRDPRTRVISSSYLALVPAGVHSIRAADDAVEAQWFAVEYTILEEKTTYLANGYRMERRIQIRLKSKSEEIFVIIEISKEKVDQCLNIERKVIDSNGLAFDHGIILYYAFERLKSKIDYTDIIFNLMPQVFTLTELQQVYEVILGEELLTANFRRKIKEKVLETNQMQKDAGHRPAKLFKYNNLDESIFY